MEKLERNLGGIKEMNELPGVIFLVDPKKERIAILEAKNQEFQLQDQQIQTAIQKKQIMQFQEMTML